MRRMGRCAAAFLAAATFAAAPAVLAAARQPGYETYVVRKGDTLSGVAKRVLGDAARWREILKENPQVTNANLIYPGDSLLVPVPLSAAGAGGLEATAIEGGEGASEQAAREAEAAARAAAAAQAAADAAAAAEAAARAAAAAAAAANAVPELPVQVVRAPGKINPALYRSAGYFADGLPAIAIVATMDDRMMLASGDVAIANVQLPAGARYTVVRADRRVFHPRSGRSLGWLMRVIGTAECTCRGSEGTSTVALIGMRDAAGIGDYLVPVDPNDRLEEDVLAAKALPECVAGGPEEGVIVAFDEDRLMAGELEFAYIDRGSTTGVGPGRRFVVYREAGLGGPVMVGELQVLRAGAGTATALITTSVQEIQVGDLLRAR